MTVVKTDNPWYTPYLLWDRDLLIKDGILHLPLYMAPFL